MVSSTSFECRLWVLTCKESLIRIQGLNELSIVGNSVSNVRHYVDMSRFDITKLELSVDAFFKKMPAGNLWIMPDVELTHLT